MLGSRFLGDPLAGGMPRWKYVSNRFLTIVENLAFGLHLSEYHTGLRAYSRPAPRADPVPAQQRRLRVRPGARRPGRRRRRPADLRDRGPDALLRGSELGRASGGASSTASRRSGSSSATCSIAPASVARPKLTARTIGPGPARDLTGELPIKPAPRRDRRGDLDRGACGSSSGPSTSPPPSRSSGPPTLRWIGLMAAFIVHGPRHPWHSAGSASSPRSATSATVTMLAVPARRLPGEQRPAGAARRAGPEPLPR